MSAVPPPPPAGDPAPSAGGSGTNGLAVTSLILGIVSIISCFYWFLAMPLGAAAAVLGFIGKGKPGGKGLAVAGIITGIVGFVLGLLGLLAIFGIGAFDFEGWVEDLQ